jgi:hypothetical protein
MCRLGFISRKGSPLLFGERLVSGLVQRLGSLDFVIDNVGSFCNGAFPMSGIFIFFGVHHIYVGTTLTCRYPSVVHVADDPSAICMARGQRSNRSVGCVEVMMASADGIGKGAAGEKDATGKPGCSAKPALERQQNTIGMSNVPPTLTLLQATINKLVMPVAADADLVMTHSELDGQRQNIHR